MVVVAASASQWCAAQLPRPTLEQRIDLAVSAGVAQVRDSLGTFTMSVVGGETALDHFDGVWAWGPAVRGWVMRENRGVSGAGVHALVRGSRVLGNAPELEVRGAVGFALTGIDVQQGSVLHDRGDLGFVYEVGATYEHRFLADAGVVFSLDAVSPTIGPGEPSARFPLLMFGVGLRRHRQENRDIPVPRAPRPVPVPGRWPWPGRPER